MKRIQFKRLLAYPQVVHGSFLRRGGQSDGPFSSLNASFNVGDDPEKVQANREIVSAELGVQSVTYARLEHGTKIERVTRLNKENLPISDALYTTDKKLAIGVTHADCQAAIFYDPVKEVIGIVHAGWRGLVQNIYEKMCLQLKREVGTNPSDLIVCISPSLGPDYAEYKNYREDFPKKYWAFQKKKNFFDFWMLAKHQLLSSGVQQMSISNICTYTDEECFSYRRDRVTGRHPTVISLRD